MNVIYGGNITGDGGGSPVGQEDSPCVENAQQADHLIVQLDTILDHVRGRDRIFAAQIKAAHPRFQESARNLLHYLALRRFDLRAVQEQLARLGLSSLGRTEAHVLASLHAVLHALCRLSGRADAVPVAEVLDFQQGQKLLAAHTEALLGVAPAGRGVRIMVTLPGEAAENYALVRGLLAAGMDCVRINCAHDDEAAWARMIEHVVQARRETGRPCRILMDLAGPKLRTGALAPGPSVLRYKPRRDLRGRVAAPARIWLVPSGMPVPEEAAGAVVLPVEASWLAEVQPGDRICFRDTRGKKRTMNVVDCAPTGCRAQARQTAYVETGTVLTLTPQETSRRLAAARVGPLPPVEPFLLLKKGDTLILYREQIPGQPATRDARGRVLTPARIACTLPQAFSDVKAGETVRLDDGKIEGIVRAVSEDEMHVEIIQAKEGGSKLRADRGINFPESTLHRHGLTEKDLADLDFAARHADIVGLSFAHAPEHVLALQDELARRGGAPLGIMLKIETQRGFQQLPWLLLAAMRSHPVGVMIARGDLAVEVGWERLAEVQEEILWLCEAAHVPVVWATQVLENLAKKGLPSRAEITDAAMAERAECVMLNKGPHILKAIQMLDNILRRMQAHQLKKTAMLRSLLVAKMSRTEPL